jgi:tetratricopeptide (TPR) repeat protein
MCHNFQKNFGPALDCLNQAAQIDPGNRLFVNAKGVVLAESGRYDESLDCFSRCSGEALGCYGWLGGWVVRW